MIYKFYILGLKICIQELSFMLDLDLIFIFISDCWLPGRPVGPGVYKGVRMSERGVLPSCSRGLQLYPWIPGPKEPFPHHL
jgi:hypothetical protein